MANVAVLGATGFVGSAVCEALHRRGHEVTSIRAPRLEPTSELDAVRAQLQRELAGASAVVNCAGMPDATSGDAVLMHLANASLPGIVAQACAGLGTRFVHVSSAAVQGRVRTLDSSSQRAPFSAYSQSKADGEVAVLATSAPAVIYRPPGVHARTRSITRAVSKVASSPLSSVAGKAPRPTAQALLPNVADAVAFLATCEEQPPGIVHHPSEGLTTRSLMTALGGRQPRTVPLPVARGLIAAGYFAARVVPQAAGVTRRVEMLWLGQEQAPSWLTKAGWQPVLGASGWSELGSDGHPAGPTN